MRLQAKYLVSLKGKGEIDNKKEAYRVSHSLSFIPPIVEIATSKEVSSM